MLLDSLHVGSVVGISNPDCGDDAYLPVREALYKKWCESVKGPWRKPDVLILAGEAVDGQGKRRGGTEQWTSNLEDQAHFAAELVSMWEARKIYCLRGSNYHVDINGSGINIDELAAQKMGAEIWPNQDNIDPKRRARSGYSLFLTIGNVTLHIAHKVSVSKVFHYRSTPIAREMMHAKLNDPMRHYAEAMQLEMGKYKTRLVVRGHAHYYWYCATSGSAGINLPCWQARSAFIEQEMPLGMCDIGFVGLEVKGDHFTHEPVLWQVEEAQPPAHAIIRGKS